MVNNSVKVIATSALVAVGVLGLVSGAKADSKYPQYNMITEGFPSTIDWASNKAAATHEQIKVVFSCQAKGDGTYMTVETVVKETVNPDVYPVYKTENLSSENGLSGESMINWTATLPSNNPKGEYTPASRCGTVSARLTNLAYAFGLTNPTDVAKIGEASLVGRVNAEKVIFISHDPAKAASGNVIFTLKPDNATAAKAPKVLTQFRTGIAGSVGGSGDPATLAPVVE
jgi:hypothetical protein